MGHIGAWADYYGAISPFKIRQHNQKFSVNKYNVKMNKKIKEKSNY